MQTSATETGYIGIGSNLQSPLQQANQAISALQQQAGITCLRRSPWFGSKAVGPGEQGNYINGVVEFCSSLPPLDLLHMLQSIENQQGRVRQVRWGARTLDLDLLCYGSHQSRTTELRLPHPCIAERDFVLEPMACLTLELAQQFNPAFTPFLKPHDQYDDKQASNNPHLWLAEGEQGVVELRL